MNTDYTSYEIDETVLESKDDKVTYNGNIKYYCSCLLEDSFGNNQAMFETEVDENECCKICDHIVFKSNNPNVSKKVTRKINKEDVKKAIHDRFNKTVEPSATLEQAMSFLNNVKVKEEVKDVIKRGNFEAGPSEAAYNEEANRKRSETFKRNMMKKIDEILVATKVVGFGRKELAEYLDVPRRTLRRRIERARKLGIIIPQKKDLH